MSATAITIRQRPSSPGSTARFRMPPRNRKASSSCSISRPSRGLATASPTRAWSTSPRPARRKEAAASISHSTAASSRARRWATSSSRNRVTPRSPIRTDSLSSSPRPRQARSTPKAAGTGGAIPTSTISARMLPRSPPFGPWSSSWQRVREGRLESETDIAIIEAVLGSDLYRQCVRLREAVLRKPLGLTVTREELADDTTRQHFCALSSGAVVGSVSLKPLDESTLQLKQMAVAEERRGQGVGAHLLAHAEAWGSSGGFFVMVLNARMGVEGFYARFGYQALGKPFAENTVPHIRMTKRLRPWEERR